MPSTTVDIPGGTATLRDPKELTKRQKRMLESVFMRMAPVAARLGGFAQAAKAVTDGGTQDALASLPALDVSDVDLTFELQNTAIVVFLESWTLVDQPLPTVDTVADLPEALYDALEGPCGKLALTPGSDFSPNPGDTDSPTSA